MATSILTLDTAQNMKKDQQPHWTELAIPLRHQLYRMFSEDLHKQPKSNLFTSQDHRHKLKPDSKALISRFTQPLQLSNHMLVITSKTEVTQAKLRRDQLPQQQTSNTR